MAKINSQKGRPVVSADDVARYIIRFAHEHGSSITNLKLQKLLYYAQGWHLAIYNKPLFGDRIEAWVYGPVVPDVYSKYQKYSYKSIDEDVDYPSFDSDDTSYLKEFLDDFLATFLPIDAFELERMTHNESPWLEARGNLPRDARCNKAIKMNTMAECFKNLASNG